MTDKEIADIYRDMELRLIESMKRNLALHTGEEAETQLEYPQWQAIKLRELRKYQKQNKDIIKRSLRGLPADVAKQLRDELKQGHESEISKYRKAIGEEKFRSSVAMNESFFMLNTRKIDGLISEIKQSLRTAEHAALRMSNDVYREVIAKSALYVSNGVKTPAQAIDMATKDFLNRGLNCIEYKDGRRVNIADYCDMAVKTANQRAYLMGEGEFRKQIGRTLVIISKHNTACPLCRPFERKVLIDDVYSGGKQSDGDYMLLSQAMQLGLFHPRCRHGLGTYYPEFEDLNGYETADNRLNDYGEHNEAHIDNMIQKYKRFVVGCLDPENVSKYRERLDYWEAQKAKLAKAESVDIDGESDIISAGKSPYSNEKVFFNPKASFKVYLPEYSESVNDGLSRACRNVASKGIDGLEHLQLVNLDTGEIEYKESGTTGSVGYKDFWEFVSNNKDKNYAFVHNHNTATSFSETDMHTLLKDNNIKMFVVSRRDGVIYVLEGKSVPSEFIFDKLYKDELSKINEMSRNGEITSGERTYLREKTIVELLIRDYTKGVVKFE